MEITVKIVQTVETTYEIGISPQDLRDLGKEHAIAMPPPKGVDVDGEDGDAWYAWIEGAMDANMVFEAALIALGSIDDQETTTSLEEIYES